MALFSRNLIRGIVDRQAALIEDAFVVFVQGTSFYERITATQDPDQEITGLPAAYAVDQQLASDTILDAEFTDINNWINDTVTSVAPTVGGTPFTSFDAYLTANGLRVHETFKNVYNRTINQDTLNISAVNTFPREVLFGTLAFSSSVAIDYNDIDAVDTNNVAVTILGAQLNTTLVASGLDFNLIVSDGLSAGQNTERVVIDLSGTQAFPQTVEIGQSTNTAFIEDVLSNSLNIELLATNAVGINTTNSSGDLLFRTNMKVLLRDGTDTDTNVNQEVNCVLSVTTLTATGLRITLQTPTKNSYDQSTVSITRLYSDVATVESVPSSGEAGATLDIINITDRNIIP